MRIPKGKKNQEFLQENLNNDQFKIAYIILSKIREWINLEKAPLHSKKKFKLLRMTIMGYAGIGKSVLINTIVACIRKIFQDNDSVIVAAPTGAAAHNVGGQTIHREFKIDVRKKKQQIICIIATNPTRKVAIYYCNIF